MEDCFLNILSKITRWLKTCVSCLRSAGPFWKSMTWVIAVFFVIWEISNNYTCLQNHIQSAVKIGTFVVTFLGGCYAVFKYRNHLQEEKRKVLCEYNQRYSTDKNIEAVIEWMVQVAKTDEKTGEIKGVNKDIKTVPPSIHKKEMFMRFFEELNIRLEKNDMNTDEVYSLFAYYALKFDNYWDFRLDIKDYKNELELRGMNVIERKAFNDNWTGFRSFIDKMEKEKSKQENKST